MTHTGVECILKGMFLHARSRQQTHEGGKAGGAHAPFCRQAGEQNGILTTYWAQNPGTQPGHMHSVNKPQEHCCTEEAECKRPSMA